MMPNEAGIQYMRKGISCKAVDRRFWAVDEGGNNQGHDVA